MTDDYIPLQRCRGCGGEFPRTSEYFYPKSSRQLTLTLCKTCAKAYQRKHRRDLADRDNHEKVENNNLKNFIAPPVCGSCGEPLKKIPGMYLCEFCRPKTFSMYGGYCADCEHYDECLRRLWTPNDEIKTKIELVCERPDKTNRLELAEVY